MTPPTVEATSVEQLRSSIQGNLITSDDSAYEQERKVWNGMVDLRPALIAQCAKTSDVVAAVNFAREHQLPVAVRCGGHSTPGYSTCDDGVVIDLRGINQVSVDPDSKTAKVGGGTLWKELDAATQEHGLAVTGGRVSDTGVGGLALGSGSGWLERPYGVTPASLRGATLVTAAGDVVHASADENAELFWGLRGGGGNFGVVTEFEFDLHPVGPIITAGMILYPRSQAREVIRNYRDYIEAAPDHVAGGVAMMTAPPEEFVPESLRGQPAVGVIFAYIGPPEQGEQAAQPLKEFGEPALTMIQPMPYAALQQLLDAGNPHGIHEYFKIDSLSALSDEAIDVAVEQAEQLPAPFGQLIMAPMGGQTGKAGKGEMALGLVEAPWSYFCLAMWMESADDERNSNWARGFAAAMRQFGVGTTLPNFIEPDEGVARLRASFGEDSYGRLVALDRAAGGRGLCLCLSCVG